MKFIKLIGLAGIVFSSLCNAQTAPHYILGCGGNVVYITPSFYDVDTNKVYPPSFDVNNIMATDVHESSDFKFTSNASIQLIGSMANGGGLVNISRFFDGHIEMLVFGINKTYQCKVIKQ